MSANPEARRWGSSILCLFGVFQSNKIMAYLAITTVILAAAYLLWMYQRVMHGPIVHDYIRSFKDLNLREIFYLAPIVFLMFWIGLYPNFFLRKMDASVSLLLRKIEEKKTYFVLEKESPKILLIRSNYSGHEQLHFMGQDLRPDQASMATSSGGNKRP